MIGNEIDHPHWHPPFRRSTRCWCGHETDDLRAHHREHVRGTR